MPTAADRIAIENLRRFSADLRGAGQQVTQGQQQVAGVQLQREQQDLARQQRVQDIEQQQGFQAQQATLGREFRAEESALGREASLDLAKLRGPETKINIQLQQQERATQQQQRITDLEKAGVVTRDATGAVTETNLGELGKSNTQAKLLRERILSLRDQKGEFSPEDENTVINNIIRQARDAGVKSPALSQLKPRKNETKEQYISRLLSFRTSLIEREFRSRLATAKKDRNFGRVRTGGSIRTGITFSPVTKENIKEQSDKIRQEVVDEFGGTIE